jgi:calmodulin
MSQTQPFDEETLGEIREGWAIIAKGKAALGLKDLLALLHWLGQNPTPQELQELMGAHGSGGQITQDQFVRSMTAKLACSNSGEDVTQAFSVFDKDGRGFISASDLRHVLTAMGDRLDEEQVEEMLRHAMGRNQGEGQLNYVQFVKSVLDK